MLRVAPAAARAGVAFLPALCCGLAVSAEAPSRGLDFARLAGLRSVAEVQLSPDGTHAAYVLRVPRVVGSGDDGPAWRELHLVSWDGKRDRPFVHGEVDVSEIRFTPDGRHVTYLAARDGDEKKSLWSVPIDGGESRRLFAFDEAIEHYRLSPDGKTLAFVATEPDSDERERLREAGYEQEVFEEDWRPRKAWIVELSTDGPRATDPAAAPVEPAEPRALPVEGSVFEVEWAPDGRHVALSVAPTPLVDDRYMQRRIRVVRAEDGVVTGAIDNPGKLGAFAWSPDGKHVAVITAADPNDPEQGRLRVAPAGGGMFSDLLPELDGHVSAIAWQDADTVMYVADVGVESVLGEVSLAGKNKTHHASGGTRGSSVPMMAQLRLSADGRRAAFVGDTPRHPEEVYVVAHGDAGPRRLTDSNPWLDDVALAPQEIVEWTARDGLRLEGVLLRPLDGATPAPLLLMVHGGPESHDRNGWVTSYSRPGQIAAAHGYAVLYPNYRGSTGRGVKFTKLGQGDPAGREFDDLIDAVDHLAAQKIADPERVGVTGGSYGGYATAWLATKHTDRFRAGVMFVGISNEITKPLTTDIPEEDRMVHTRYDPWTRWEFSLERSPIYWAEQSRTALLIAGGTADTRVDPSQSLQLYRALKLVGKTPVRYVRYPGQKHGNTAAAARDDYTRRILGWMDHFVRYRRSDLPPWEIDHDLARDEEDEERDEDESEKEVGD
jgi:dipeptidyl aminopeptidase/acylaminoacyl peptidase